MRARFGGASFTAPLASKGPGSTAAAPAAMLRRPRPTAFRPGPAAVCPVAACSTTASRRQDGRTAPRSRPLPTITTNTTTITPYHSLDHHHGRHRSSSYLLTHRRASSAWAAAVSVAGNIVSNAFTRAKTNDMAIDPLRVVAKEMKHLIGDVRKLLGSGHPSLDRVAKYYTQAEGKHMRPLIVLLMSRATYLCPKAPPPPSPYSSQQQPHQHYPSQPPLQASAGVDVSLSPLSVLSDFNPAWSGTVPSSFSDSPTTAAPSASSSSPPPADGGARPEILPSQRRLAEITELIHTASLLHDDVIDHSESRRGAPSANLAFGNKMAVLAGDFLLGRASVALARLRNAEVVELLATVIANLVEGEFMQLKNTASRTDGDGGGGGGRSGAGSGERSGAGGSSASADANPEWSEATLQYYLQKTYLKTASLISKSCRAAALLGGADHATVEAAYSYGKNLGLAFQLVDDMLDYTRSTRDLGKPAGADLELGLATAPLLFAWRGRPELGPLVGRRFSQPGDVQMARDIVLATDGVEQTRALAQTYGEQAVAAISAFPASEAKDGLIEMVAKTVKRQK